VDPYTIRNTKWNLDVAGHYARPDAFQLTIRTTPDPIIRIEEVSLVSKPTEIKEQVPTKLEVVSQEVSKFEGG